MILFLNRLYSPHVNLANENQLYSWKKEEILLLLNMIKMYI